jgi:hypothetical protein
MDTLGSHFFGDLISRLIPGIVIIGLYGKHLLIRADHAFHGPSVLLTVCIFFVAWLIGATLDTLTFRPVIALFKLVPDTWTLSWLRDKLLPNLQQGGTSAPKTGNATPIAESDAQKYDRLQRLRMEAERALFRCMMCISALTIIWWPTTFSGVGWIRYFYSVVGTGIFFVCWWFSRKALIPKEKEGVQKTAAS